jgi:hypothetical protein
MILCCLSFSHRSFSYRMAGGAQPEGRPPRKRTIAQNRSDWASPADRQNLLILSLKAFIRHSLAFRRKNKMIHLNQSADFYQVSVSSPAS